MKTFQNTIKNIQLPSEKKNQMWASIVDKIELWENSLGENVRMDEVKRHTEWGAYIKPSPLYPNQKNMVNTKIFATMLVIIASIMGTSFAAEQSLPGDSLYAFKVEVNESVRGALTFGAEAEAKWEIEKIERRAREKMELEAQAELTTTAEAEIESRSQTSADKVEAIIVRLQAEGKAEAATSLEGGLNTALKAIVSHESKTNTDTKVKSETAEKFDGVVDIDAKTSGSTNSSTHSDSEKAELKLDVDTDTKVDLDL